MFRQYQEISTVQVHTPVQVYGYTYLSIGALVQIFIHIQYILQRTHTKLHCICTMVLDDQRWRSAVNRHPLPLRVYMWSIKHYCLLPYRPQYDVRQIRIRSMWQLGYVGFSAPIIRDSESCTVRFLYQVLYCVRSIRQRLKGMKWTPIYPWAKDSISRQYVIPYPVIKSVPLRSRFWMPYLFTRL